MESNKTERRCKRCNKLLLDVDAKAKICRRCFLERRNKTAKIAGALVGTGLSTGASILIAKNHNDNIDIT